MDAMKAMEDAIAAMSKLAKDAGSDYSCVKTSKNNHTVFLIIAEKNADKFFIAKSFIESLAEDEE